MWTSNLTDLFVYISELHSTMLQFLWTIAIVLTIFLLIAPQESDSFMMKMKKKKKMKVYKVYEPKVVKMVVYKPKMKKMKMKKKPKKMKMYY